MNRVELLAPAGSLEKLKTAIIYGADAVYIGGEAFSLREAAENFSLDDVQEAVDFAHAKNAKVYVALNIFPHNGEIEEILQYAKKIHKIGVDAAIVADLGIFSMLREAVPDLELHVSTQANSVNFMAAAAWYKLGAKRVVLARELSFEEMQTIREKTPIGLELEVFVHGAMCISYSGRCLLSNYMAGKDSNQGACAQPCRWKYHLVEEKRPGEYMPIVENDTGTFIFNSKDLCLIEYLPQLIRSGVTSLKIEGRVKSEYYVASVVKAYREAIDEYYRDGEDYVFDSAHLEELKKISHRDYTTGFALHRPGSDAQVYTSSSYIRNYDIIGVVLAYDEETGIATVKQRNRFFLGDEIEIIQPMIPGFLTHRVEFLQDAEGKEIKSAPHADMTLKMKFGTKVLPGSFLRKIRT